MSDQENYVMKICTALSNKPTFVRITNPGNSLDSIISEAILTLRNSGKPLESEQLDQLYKNHQLFNQGKLVQKGTFYSELQKQTQQIGDQTVHVAEIDLVSSHAGGVSGVLSNQQLAEVYQAIDNNYPKKEEILALLLDLPSLCPLMIFKRLNQIMVHDFFKEMYTFVIDYAWNLYGDQPKLECKMCPVPTAPQGELEIIPFISEEQMQITHDLAIKCPKVQFMTRLDSKDESKEKSQKDDYFV